MSPSFLSAAFRSSQPNLTAASPAVPPHQVAGGAYRDSEDNSNIRSIQGTLEKTESRAWADESRPLTRQRQRRSSGWSRGLTGFLFASDREQEFSLPLLPFHTNQPKRYRGRWLRRSTRSCCLLYCLIAILAMLGVIQSITLACGFIISFFPDEIDRATDHWRQPPGLTPSDNLHWPTDISRDIIPVGCHSHNDYWRRVPLYSALEAGCIGVEADVWLFDDELYVGHSISSLTPTRTLQSMYIDPLMRILRRQNPVTNFHPSPDQPRNGVFDTDPSQSVILLIDFKTDGDKTFDSVQAQLSPLRESGYLTYYNGTGIVNGPITVVGTGNTPFNRVTANTKYWDIFFDAPLDRLVDKAGHVKPSNRLESRAENAGQGLSGVSSADIDPDTFNQTNSYYASVNFKKAVGVPWMFRLTERQVQTIRSQIQAAHRQGLKVRYWGTPSWPRSLRNHVWHVLAREGADMLNVDDLKSATRKDWTPAVSDWWH
ncbi:PLC-like phosphodiesterase [Aspergillus egyptiacus]|nr:PLC-like phosphodiesterase [Aspergillus egyptiacus]